MALVWKRNGTSNVCYLYAKNTSPLRTAPWGRQFYLKNLGPDAGVYVRIGSTNRKADTAIIQEMRRTVANETFDESPIVDLDSEALDFRAASESFSKRERFTKADAQTLRLLAPHGQRWRTAIVSFSDMPRRSSRLRDSGMSNGRPSPCALHVSCWSTRWCATRKSVKSAPVRLTSETEGVRQIPTLLRGETHLR